MVLDLDLDIFGDSGSLSVSIVIVTGAIFSWMWDGGEMVRKDVSWSCSSRYVMAIAFFKGFDGPLKSIWQIGSVTVLYRSYRQHSFLERSTD